MSDINRPILITGCARSGTSLVAGIINRCGAWGGKMTGRTRYNQRGQYENNEIRNNIVKPALRAAGFDPMGQNPLPDPLNFPIDDEWNAKVVGAILRQGYKNGPWFYKGAKMCLIWTQWHQAFPNAKWIIVRRDTKGIVESCLRTSFMRAYKNHQGWNYWVSEHLDRFKEMHDAGLDIVQVWAGPIAKEFYYDDIKSAVEHVGLKWDQGAVDSFVDSSLFHATNGSVKEE